MASNLTKTSGSIFMGNPITYSVKSAAESTPSDITFHRVKLKIDISGHETEMSIPAGSGETVEFDISSAFRAASDNYEYGPVTEARSYPLFMAHISARDVWLKNGELIDPAPGNAAIVNAECTAIMGGYSDFERHKASQTLSFTRKPSTTPEIVCVGDKYLFSSMLNDAPKTSLVVIGDAAIGSMVRLDNGYHVFAVAKEDRRSRQFQFVNSRGVVESIRAWGLETEKLNSSAEEFAISRLETFSEFTRIISRKKASRTELTLCSGFVTYEWARWWAAEFCQSNQHWMLENDVWIPCSVRIDDSFTLIDKTKSQLCYVTFTCKPDVDGVMW